MNSQNQKSMTKGNVWVGFLVLLVFMIGIGLALTNDILGSTVQAKRAGQVIIAQALSDAGVERAIWKLNSGASYSGENGAQRLSFATGELDIFIETQDTENKEVTAVAYVPNFTNKKITRKVRAKLRATPTNENAAFHYALQAGEGGIYVGGSSDIFGNLYSNADITFSGGAARVRGDAFAHGTVSPNPNPKVDGSIQIGVPVVPLPDIDINNWIETSSQGEPIIGNYSPAGTVTIGRKKITGNFSMSGTGAIVNLNGPLYIQGDFSTTGGEIRLSNELGTDGTIIIVDGKVTIGGGSRFITNGGGGYILVISTSDLDTAMDYSGSAASEALAMYAPFGGMTLSGSGEIIATCGKTLYLTGSGEIRYKSGLANANFSAGPGGYWKIKEWQIVH